jgi:hypothetical protein
MIEKMSEPQICADLWISLMKKVAVNLRYVICGAGNGEL